MSDLGDLIKGAGDAHATALDARRDEGANRDHATTSMVAHIRRRRAFRAGATGLVAAVGVGALAVTAVAALGPDEQAPAVPAITGAGNRCDLDTYPAPNADAVPFYGLEGRLYADFTTDTYMYRTIEGDLRQLEPDDEGMWSDPTTGDSYSELTEVFGPGGFVDWGFDRMVFDVLAADQLNYVEDPTHLYHEWTTVLPEEVSDGIVLYMLAQVHQYPLVHTGYGVDATMVGADDVVEQVITRTDGTEASERILFGAPTGDVEDYTGLESVTTRVTSPTGEITEITSAYDSSQSFEAVCGENTSQWQDEMAQLETAASPSASAEPVRAYLDGPEAEVFVCGEPLDDTSRDEPVWQERRSGIYYDEDEAVQLDYGDGATVVALAGMNREWSDFELSDGYLSRGWGGGYSEDADGNLRGSHSFLLLAFVDDEAAIVGYSDPWTDDGTFNVWGGWGPHPEQVHVGDSVERIACDDVDEGTLDAAAPVLLTGVGASVDTMEWSWFEVMQD